MVADKKDVARDTPFCFAADAVFFCCVSAGHILPVAGICNEQRNPPSAPKASPPFNFHSSELTLTRRPPFFFFAMEHSHQDRILRYARGSQTSGVDPNDLFSPPPSAYSISFGRTACHVWALPPEARTHAAPRSFLSGITGSSFSPAAIGKMYSRRMHSQHKPKQFLPLLKRFGLERSASAKESIKYALAIVFPTPSKNHPQPATPLIEQGVTFPQRLCTFRFRVLANGCDHRVTCS